MTSYVVIASCMVGFPQSLYFPFPGSFNIIEYLVGACVHVCICVLLCLPSILSQTCLPCTEITLWPLWSYSRTFHKLSTLMAEEGNCTLYHKAICTDLKNGAAFVPYLGFILTQVVHQTCHQKMQQFHIRRKGAMMKRNKILLPPTTARNQPYGTLRSSSCPNGYGEDVDDSMGRDAHANQSKEDITCVSRTLPSSENENNACPSIVLFPSFSSSERVVVSRQSAFLPMYHRCVQSTHNIYSDSLSADWHAPSEYPTSCLKTYHSEELLDSLCHNEASAIDDATPDMCASFSSLGSMSGLDDQPRNCLSDSVLHTASDSAADIGGEENDLLSLSYPGVTSPNFSSSAGSFSPESGRRCLQSSTSGGDLHRLGDSGIYSTYSSSADESHVADISRCALSSAKSSDDIIDTGNAEIPSLPHQRSKSRGTTVGGEFIEDHCPTCSASESGTSKRSHPTKCSACAKQANVLEHHHRGAVQLDFGDLKDIHNPKALLQRYQTCSLGCGQGMQRNEEIGRLIGNYHCNTERENYELSYETEPQLTLGQRSSLSPGAYGSKPVASWLRHRFNIALWKCTKMS